MKNQKKKTAFSMLEMSIALLIVGLVFAAISKGSALLAYNKLMNARTVTNSSPLSSIPDLAIWYETTTEESFNESDIKSSTKKVGTWKDLNMQSVTKNNAAQATGDRPLYVLNCINSLPCLRFDGVNDYLNYDGSVLAKTDYTIFVVDQRTSGKSNNYFMVGDNYSVGYAPNTNLQLGYSANSVIFYQYGNDTYDNNIVYYNGEVTPRIHAFMGSTTFGRKYYLNGVRKTLQEASSVNYYAVLDAYPLAGIGGSQIGWYYAGDIGEMIMFTRHLSDEERRAVESYLSRKWRIKLG